MPNRLIRDGINDSEAVNGLSDSGELLYRRLLSWVDDYGRQSASPRLIRGKVFALQLDRWSEERISVALQECARRGLIILYSVGMSRYLQIQKFKQQIRAKVSKFPAPAEHVCSECVADANATQSDSSTSTTTPPSVVLKEKVSGVLEAELVPVEPAREDQDPVAILAEVRRIYVLGGLPIPDNPRLEQNLIQQIISVDRPKRPRILNYVKFCFASGRWPNAAKTKAFRNVMADGDWDVELTQRTLPNAREPTAIDAARAAASAKAAEYMREKGRL